MGGSSSDGSAVKPEDQYVVYKYVGTQKWYFQMLGESDWTTDLCSASRFIKTVAQVRAACMEGNPYYIAYATAIAQDHQSKLGSNYFNPNSDWEFDPV